VPHAQTVYANHQFCRILVEVVEDCFGNGCQGLSVEEAYEYYFRLEAWFNNLPQCLTAKNAVLPSHFRLQYVKVLVKNRRRANSLCSSIHYHMIQSMLFKQYISPDGMKSRIPSNMTKTPEEITREEKLYMETTLRLQYLRHGFVSYDAFIILFLTHYGFELIQNPHHPEETLSSLILIVKGLNDQGKSFHLGNAMSRMLRDKMTPEDLNILGAYMDMKNTEEEKSSEALQHIHSTWPVNVVSITDSLEEKRIDNVIRQMAGVTISNADSDGSLSDRSE
jgi:hypothetical protein